MTPHDSIELSIIAPMFNEEDNVPATIMAIEDAMASFSSPWELIFVNDGSTDNTLDIARKWEQEKEFLHVVSYPLNCGRGKALREGIRHARGKYVVTIDFDLSYSPDHILKIYQVLADPLKMVDVVLASAYMDGGKTIGVPPMRLLASRLGNFFLQFAFPQPFQTTTCILRGYKRRVLESIHLTSNSKEIHLEILSKVCALGFRIVEIPATLMTRKKGTSKFRFRRTAFTHVLFSLFEKPILLFGVVGLLLALLGLGQGIYIILLKYSGLLDPNRPLIPFMILLLVVGSQFLCFAFIASQNNYLRKEIYRLQAHILKLESDSKK